jgi:hypothetical protein
MLPTMKVAVRTAGPRRRKSPIAEVSNTTGDYADRRCGKEANAPGGEELNRSER